MTSQIHTPLLKVEDVCVTFGYIEALKDVSLTVNSHEILAIVGDNGAGKSTLLKAISGLQPPDTGTFIWKDNEVSISSVKAANDIGISATFQSADFCDNLDIAANIFLGNELHTFFGNRDDNTMHIKSRKLLHKLTSPLSTYRSMHGLSMGERQTVSIARSLLTNPELILMDEPTASLSIIQTAQVLSYIKELRNHGRTIVLVCHNLPDIFAIADRIAVMRAGQITAVHKISETSYEQIVAEIAGARTVNEEFINVDTMTVPRKIINRYN
ncbi:ATP-binding cassette domain-containing protein [Alloscardovia venturai]|uniref:ATP-binding cassette domain-containing protein n=1 Tax=Alloscardovia venturai TaxID=1769421 RepID=A0ABW2Y446_9BIFI